MENPLNVTLLRKTASVNNINLIIGETISLSIKNGAKFVMFIESGAIITLENLGDTTIRANCEAI